MLQTWVVTLATLHLAAAGVFLILCSTSSRLVDEDGRPIRDRSDPARVLTRRIRRPVGAWLYTKR